MLDVKTAVARSIDYLKELYKGEGTELTGLMLEEVELTIDNKHWNVTIGFDRPKKYATTFFPLLAPATERVYKMVTISSDNGQFVSMKMRETPDK